jgi:PIN domain nuclease of toxin-antitoxin system
VSRPILLDTCAAIWISQDDSLAVEAGDALVEAENTPGAIVVSPITAWEIGILVARGRITLSREPTGWFHALIDAGVELAPMSPDILVASSFLPGTTLRDPADRILAATARAMNYRLMTRDRLLLNYAAAGHLAAIAC